jgi:hypothetical protein
MIPLTRLKGGHAAPRLSNLTNTMVTPDTGVVTGAAHQASAQITFEQLLVEAEQKALEQELSRLETALGTIRNQSSALESALSGPS